MYFLLLFLFFNCDYDHSNSTMEYMINANDSSLSDSLKSTYLDDSYRLSLRYFMETDSNWVNVIEIPEDLVHVYYNGLVHIFNARQIPARDSVVDLFPIHTFPNPVLNRVILGIDTTSSWITNWIKGQRLTGNEKIDELMVKYNFQVKKILLFFSTYHVLLETPYQINIQAIARIFSRVESVNYSEPDAAGGDGNDIITSRADDYVIFEYYLRWGDCPCGCTEEHVWYFKVSFDGEVKFLYSNGDPVNEYTPWKTN